MSPPLPEINHMTELRASYTTGEKTADINEFRGRACSLHWENPGYKPPTPEDFKDLKRLSGWSNTDMARLAGIHYTVEKGSPTIGRWRASPGSRNHQQIPYSVWRLLLIYAGVVDAVDDCEALGVRQ